MLLTQRFELDWIAAFQGDGALKRVMIGLSDLGSEAVAYVLPFAYFFLSKNAGARLYLLFSFSGTLLHIFKLAFHSPRPYWIDARITALSSSGSYGMPSGHVLSASIMWPFIAKTLGQSWAWRIAVTLVLLVSVSRVYLGVHYISDVAAAWGIGAGLHWCFERIERKLSKWLNLLSLWWQIAIAFWGALVIVAIGLGVKLAIGDVVDPPSWSMYSANARDLGGLFRSVGEFFGAACGMIMAGRYACFEVSGALWMRGVAFGYALAGAWLIRQFFGMIPSPPIEGLHFLFNFVRGAVPNWWMLLVAPWILIKMGLLQTHDLTKCPRNSSV